LFLVFVLFIFALPVQAATSKTLVLLPLVMHADETKAYLKQGIQTMLISRLSGNGIEIIAGQGLENLLNPQDKNGIENQTKAEEFGRHLKVDFAIFGSFTNLGSGYSLDLSILDFTQAPVNLTNISQVVTEDQLILKLADIAYQFRSVIEGKKYIPQSANPDNTAVDEGIFMSTEDRSLSLKPVGNIPVSMDLISMDLGDIDQDNQLELLLLSRDNLFVFTRKGTTLILKQTLKSSLGEIFYKVSVGELNNDGKLEVLLISLLNGHRAQTTIYGWSQGLKKTSQMFGHLRFLKGPNAANNLIIFQNSESNKFFSGNIFIMKSDPNGKLVKGDQIKFAPEVRFYTLGLINLGHNSIPDFSGLGKDSRPYIWNRDGAVLWNDEERVGGSNNYLIIKQIGTSVKEDGQRFEIESPMVVADMDRDGQKEVLAIKNIPFLEFLADKTYLTSRMVAYKIKESSLVQAWISKEIQSCIMDMQVDGKTLYVAVRKKASNILNKGSSNILWFE
jgi:hypothetical protein